MRFLAVLAASSLLCSIASARSYAYDDPTVPSKPESSLPQPSGRKKIPPSNVAPSSPQPSTRTTPGSETPSQDPNRRRIYFGNQRSQREIEMIYGVTLAPNTFPDVVKPYLEVSLIGCSKISNAQNVGRKPHPRFKGKYLYDELGSMVCKFSVASNFDGVMDIQGSPPGFSALGSHATDFRGNGMNLETMIANGDMEHSLLPAKISKAQPFTLTTYFRYTQTGKDLFPLRSLIMNFDVQIDNGSKNKKFTDVSLNFKSVNVDEDNSLKK